MNTIRLLGCTPSPLAAYLKALGVLRLVAEQVDPAARGHWENEAFLLTTRLSRDELIKFFLEEYEPTPLLSPWNGGSGFYRQGNETAWQTLEAIKAAKAERFQPMVDAVTQMAEQVHQLGLAGRPDGETKKQLLLRLRANLSDDALVWLDAAVLLTQDDPKYPPLLGTGGNDGRLDFTSNYMQRLQDLMDLDSGQPQGAAEAQLRAALLAESAPGFGKASIGQFFPGAAGGPNATTGFTGEALINPWDFVLMLEGALLFAAVVTRRLEEGAGDSLSYPFTVRSAGAGSGASASIDEEQARAEVWLPLWSRPAALEEIQSLLSEGRASLNRRIARDGLDFARAVAKLGVDRGITSFQRYAFLMRSGKAYLATPLNRISVSRRPHADLIDELDRGKWLLRLRQAARRQAAPQRFLSLSHRLENALFELARSGSARATQEVLIQLGAVHAYLASSPGSQELIPPLSLLRSEWVNAADDSSHEFRIAAALAGLNGGLPMRQHLMPLNAAKPQQWHPGSLLCVWGTRGLEENLFLVLERRRQEAAASGQAAHALLMGTCPADKAAIAAFLAGRTNDRHISALLYGLSLTRLPAFLPYREQAAQPPLPAIYRLMKPLFTPDAQLQEIQLLAPDQSLPLPAALPRLLQAEQIPRAISVAVRRRRASGLPAASWQLQAGHVSGRRLLAGLTIPIDKRLLKELEKSMQGQTTRPAAEV